MPTLVAERIDDSGSLSTSVCGCGHVDVNVSCSLELSETHRLRIGVIAILPRERSGIFGVSPDGFDEN
jgi:hypothetical protein